MTRELFTTEIIGGLLHDFNRFLLNYDCTTEDMEIATELFYEFIQEKNTVEVKCMNCGEFHLISYNDLKEDNLGVHFECTYCESTSNVDSEVVDELDKYYPKLKQ